MRLRWLLLVGIALACTPVDQRDDRRASTQRGATAPAAVAESAANVGTGLGPAAEPLPSPASGAETAANVGTGPAAEALPSGAGSLVSPSWPPDEVPLAGIAAEAAVDTVAGPEGDGGLDELVAELGVAVGDGNTAPELYTDGTQTAVAAEWAGSEDLRTPRITTGETLHGICPDGVSLWRTEVGRTDVRLHGDVALPSGRRTLCLMTKTRPPSPQARLEARALSRVGADGTKLQRWVGDKFGRRLVAVGEVRGVFGGGVDRIVVFKSARPISFEDDERPFGEVALLVEAATPIGLLPLDDYESGEPERIQVNLQVGGAVDLDGDGVEEVLWLSEDLRDDGSGPLLQVSYFAGEHRVHDVLRKSYSTVVEFGGTRRR